MVYDFVACAYMLPYPTQPVYAPKSREGAQVTPAVPRFSLLLFVNTFYISSFHSKAVPSHSLHHPNQLLRTHFAFPSGDLVGMEVGVEVGEGSTQMSPNHAFDVHE